MFEHLISKVIVQFSCGYVAIFFEEMHAHVEQMEDEIEKVVFFELLCHVVVIGFEQVAPHSDLKGVAVVQVDQKKTNSYRSEQTPYIRQYLVYLLEGPTHRLGNRRFVYEKSSV